MGFKTPLSLLSERCQKLGWERPTVEPRKLGNGELHALIFVSSYLPHYHLDPRSLLSSVSSHLGARKPPALGADLSPSSQANGPLSSLSAVSTQRAKRLNRYRCALRRRRVRRPWKGILRWKLSELTPEREDQRDQRRHRRKLTRRWDGIELAQTLRFNFCPLPILPQPPIETPTATVLPG